MAKNEKKDEANPLGFTPKVVKRVTMPTLKLVPDVPAYIRILDPIFDGKASKSKDGKDEEKKPPKILNVIDLTTGQAMQLVCGTVVVSEISENYEKNSYVGKCFEIIKGKQVDQGGGRGYFTYQITEIEDPGVEAA